jgi:predicted protein tyrosine phosphatase
MSDLMNRLGNCKNYHQGKFKRVLCVCSAGLLRSPTTDLEAMLKSHNLTKKVLNLGIPDNFAYRDPKLVRMIKANYDAISSGEAEEDKSDD